MKLPSLLLAAATLTGCQPSADIPASASNSQPQKLRLATWNMGTIVTPTNLATLKDSCLPKDTQPQPGQRYIACDAVEKIDRTTEDMNALTRYADKLDADVIGLQDVDGSEAAQQVLRNYNFCFTGRSQVHNTGFAIREGIPFKCGEDLTAISLDDRLPRGAELILYPGESREMHLLSIHLQYGCGRAPLNEQREACTTLSRQVPELKRWIDSQIEMNRSFAVLGGFNRDLAADTGPARNEAGELVGFWAEINSASQPDARLVNTVEGHPFQGCTPPQNVYPGYFDQVVLSPALAARRKSDELIRIIYDPTEAQQRKLSNQCPVGIELDVTT